MEIFVGDHGIVKVEINVRVVFDQGSICQIGLLADAEPDKSVGSRFVRGAVGQLNAGERERSYAGFRHIQGVRMAGGNGTDAGRVEGRNVQFIANHHEKSRVVSGVLKTYQVFDILIAFQQVLFLPSKREALFVVRIEGADHRTARGSKSSIVLPGFKLEGQVEIACAETV